MTANIKVEVCPQCGAPVKLSSSKCEYCSAEFLVTSLAYLDKFDKNGINKYISQYKQMLKDDPDNGEVNLAMGICYLDLGLLDLATKFFGKAIESIPDSADAYYYQAIAQLKGRRPKVLGLTDIRKVEEYLNAAIQLDNSRAKYYSLWALVKYDFYLKNGMKMNPPTLDELLTELSTRQSEKGEVEKMLRRVPVDDSEILSLIAQ
jgi:tetratricopeptide (TPR) repeat protein